MTPFTRTSIAYYDVFKLGSIQSFRIIYFSRDGAVGSTRQLAIIGRCLTQIWFCRCDGGNPILCLLPSPPPSPQPSPPPSPPPPPPPYACPPGITTFGCSDIPPDINFTCAQQQSFGKCCSSYLLTGNSTYPDGYCQITCGRCRCAGRHLQHSLNTTHASYYLSWH